MKITGIIRRVDDLGRIVIPKEIRRQVFGKTDATGEQWKYLLMKEMLYSEDTRKYKLVNG